jgi:hypothetical protein
MSKQRYTQLYPGDELSRLEEGHGELSTPVVIYQNGAWFADADELRTWRSANTSTVKHE